MGKTRLIVHWQEATFPWRHLTVVTGRSLALLVTPTWQLCTKANAKQVILIEGSFARSCAQFQNVTCSLGFPPPSRVLGKLGPGHLGPGQLGPMAQLSGSQLSGAQLSEAQLSTFWGCPQICRFLLKTRYPNIAIQRMSLWPTKGILPLLWTQPVLLLW